MLKLRKPWPTRLIFFTSRFMASVGPFVSRYRRVCSRLDCPLLFAKHEGCLASTDEGFEDVAATFPRCALCQ